MSFFFFFFNSIAETNICTTLDKKFPFVVLLFCQLNPFWEELLLLMCLLFRSLFWPLDTDFLSLSGFQFKTLLLFFKTLHGLTPQYLSQLTHPHAPVKAMRSTHQLLCGIILEWPRPLNKSVLKTLKLSLIDVFLLLFLLYCDFNCHC